MTAFTSLPYSGNGGFFFIRNNNKSVDLFNSLFLGFSGPNEQMPLNQLLAEHVSLHGLKVKVLDEHYFPTGFVYHNRPDIMRAVFAGTLVPYIFHMSWTKSKINKLLYFQQMGEWFVEDKCIGVQASLILNDTLSTKTSGALITSCCSAIPLISCHYRNKPSIINCSESNSTDPNGASFW